LRRNHAGHNLRALDERAAENRDGRPIGQPRAHAHGLQPAVGELPHRGRTLRPRRTHRRALALTAGALIAALTAAKPSPKPSAKPTTAEASAPATGPGAAGPAASREASAAAELSAARPARGRVA
jgi:hypothetical protein